MNLDNLTFKLYHKQSADRVFVVLHGSGTEGIESAFISRVIEGLTKTGQNVFGFNFPYCERGDKKSSGPDLDEEVNILKQVIEQFQAQGYEITIVAKSLGGIIASFYLERYPSSTVELIILGYVIGDVKTQAITRNLKTIIQGERDRFGGIKELETELGGLSTRVLEIKEADHSYRNDRKEPVFQDVAVRELVTIATNKVRLNE